MPISENEVNVLVVDDEENIRTAVERIISKLGCRVFKAADGESGLKIMEQEYIGIVFLDLKMPGKDGMDVQKEIREKYRDVLVIIITGYATIEVAIESMKQGAYDFIPKPFEAEQLRMVTKRALEKIYLTRETARLQEERSRTLMDLSTEKSRTQTILEALPNGVLVTNTNVQVVLMNQVARNLLMLEGDKPIGGYLENYVTDRGLCEFVRNIPQKNLQEGEEIPSYELQWDKDNYYLVKGNPIIGEDGNFLGVAVVFSDISSIKILDNLKSEFVAKVSHELRSPLSTIHEQMAMVVQDMLEDEESDEDKQILSRAKERTRNMITLVEDLLDLSRLESGVAFQDEKSLQVEDLLYSLQQDWIVQAEEKSQDFELVLPEQPLPPVYADSRALESVFNNLVSNAVKYTPEQGRIRVEAWSESSEEVIVKVEDNGFGMDEEAQKRIFERFYRVKDDKTRFIGGTGLGLPIVKGILDDLGGSINLASEPGKGSAFEVRIPAESDSS